MDPQLPLERRITSTENREKYDFFKNSIEAGSCTAQELRKAFNEKLINLEQCNKLLFLLAEKLEKRASIDVLTNVLNRAFLEPNLEELIKELNSDIEKRKLPVKSVMVIFSDLKEFKKLNDTHGHLAGDKALIAVARRLKDGTKRQDMVFRVGGDEFVVLLPITDDNSRLLEVIFERIKNSINTDLSIKHKGTDISFKVSMGFEVFKKGDTTTATELLHKADKKMYKDKNR